MILALRTDKPMAELYLISPDGKTVVSCKWLADRALADNLLDKIDATLAQASLSFDKLTGIVVFTGSGSFTGLRIGTAVANTIAYAKVIPIVTAAGDNWIDEGVKSLVLERSSGPVTPQYQSSPNITHPD